MSRLGFQTASTKPTSFIALTGLDLIEFNKLKPFFQEAFSHHIKMFTVSGKTRENRAFSDYENGSLATIEDKLFFVLVFVKQNLTQEVMAFMFSMSQPKVHDWLQTLIPVLKHSLSLSGDLPENTKEKFFELVKDKKDPLFVTTVQNGPLNDLWTNKSKISTTVERKKITLSRII
jgi:Helix-turn-helix of DDE superfamily endonuclease